MRRWRQKNNQFNFVDVVNEINNKLVRRHPHVFADKNTDRKKTASEEELNSEWEKHKKSERAEKSTSKITSGENQQTTSLLDGIASTLPALRWSEKLQKRATHHGFNWDNVDPVFEKLQEEIAELKAEIGIENNQQRISDELGDILFASVNLAHHLGANPEQALRDSNRRFISRFGVVEQLLAKDGKQMENCSVDILEEYWQKAKKQLAADADVDPDPDPDPEGSDHNV